MVRVAAGLLVLENPGEPGRAAPWSASEIDFARFITQDSTAGTKSNNRGRQVSKPRGKAGPDNRGRY